MPYTFWRGNPLRSAKVGIRCGREPLVLLVSIRSNDCLYEWCSYVQRKVVWSESIGRRASRHFGYTSEFSIIINLKPMQELWPPRQKVETYPPAGGLLHHCWKDDRHSHSYRHPFLRARGITSKYFALFSLLTQIAYRCQVSTPLQSAVLLGYFIFPTTLRLRYSTNMKNYIL